SVRDVQEPDPGLDEHHRPALGDGTEEPAEPPHEFVGCTVKVGVVRSDRRGSHMGRKLLLVLLILAVVAMPVPALARGHKSHGGPFVSVDIFAGPYVPAPYPAYYAYPVPYPYYAYAPPACSWQPGYWVNRPYVDTWGRYTYVQQWVPAQYVCN